MAKDAATPTWSRKIGWRQGHVIPAEALSELRIPHESDTLVMVVSHDCDLAHDDLDLEPAVEVVVGRRISAPNPGFTRTRSPRTLHLEVNCDNETNCVELVATAKRLIPKSALAAWRPDARYSLDPNGLITLRHWLAVRYNRAAFPDEFVRRMQDETGLARKLEKILKKFDEVVSAAYFLLKPLDERAAEDPRPYELTIVLSYEQGMDPDENDSQASDAAEEIREAFRNKCFDDKTNSWKHIKLVDAIAYSEGTFTISDVKHLQQWRLEHVSLKPDSDSATPFGMAP